MFTGLSAFPITPFRNEHIDFSAFEKILERLVNTRVDSICAMGSTGLYPYLRRDEFFTVAQKAVELSQGIPVMAGIGALRTKDVIENAELAQKAGVSAVLLAPVSYHPLKEKEVLSLYEAVTAELSVPLCVYENPGVTNFTFSDELYGQVTNLPNVAAIKIPGMPFASEAGKERLSALRSILPESVAIGVSADKFGAAGMAAGCDLWLSVLGGLFPSTVKKLLSNANKCPFNTQFDPLFELFINNKGGLRVMATAAHILGYTVANCLPAPLRTLDKKDTRILEILINELALE